MNNARSCQSTARASNPKALSLVEQGGSYSSVCSWKEHEGRLEKVFESVFSSAMMCEVTYIYVVDFSVITIFVSHLQAEMYAYILYVT